MSSVRFYVGLHYIRTSTNWHLLGQTQHKESIASGAIEIRLFSDEKIEWRRVYENIFYLYIELTHQLITVIRFKMELTVACALSWLRLTIEFDWKLTMDIFREKDDKYSTEKIKKIVYSALPDLQEDLRWSDCLTNNPFAYVDEVLMTGVCKKKEDVIFDQRLLYKKTNTL